MGTNGAAQVEVRGVVAAAFDHWDSRENDPNLHTHVVIANRVQGPDGRWRTLDSRAVHKAAVALSERYDTLLADNLTERLGLGWEYRERGPGRNPAFELTVVPAALVELFSRRSVAIDEETDRLVAEYLAKHGRRPDSVTVLRLRQQATLATRGAKEVHSLAHLTTDWHHRAGAALGADSRSWAAAALGQQVDPPDFGDPTLAPSLVADASTAVIAALTGKRSTWTAWNVEAEASRALKAHRFGTPASRDAATAAVVQDVIGRCVLLTPPEVAPTPPQLRRSDGTSAFRHHRAERYTAPALLDAERRLLVASRDSSAPMLHGPLNADLIAGLDPDQAAAATAVATSGRIVDVLVGPAGSGKTRTLAALRAAWEVEHGPGSVVGLAPSAAAADVLGASLGVAAENTAKWLVEHDAEPGRLHRIDQARAARHATRDPVRLAALAQHTRELTALVERWRFHPGQLVVVDEASLAGTLTMDRIAACAAEAGAKLLLVGDWAQLSAIDAGGAFGLLARDRGPDLAELGTARRFTQPWEREATTRLRVGDPAAVDAYLAHDRVTEGSHDDMVDTAYTAWAADGQAGKRSLLLAGDIDTVRTLNERARGDLVAAGTVQPDGTRLHDGLHAGVGDRILTRRNNRRLTVGAGWVKNGDTWTVTGRLPDGSLRVQRLGGGPAVVLPAAYVAEHVQLGYATTAFRAQGATVDTAHAVVTGPGMTREVLYVMLTRARETNRAYVCTDRAAEPLSGFADEPVTGRSVLLAVLSHVGAATSAHEVRDLEAEQARSIRILAAEYETLAHHAQATRWAAMLAAAGLRADVLAAVEESPAFGALSVALRRAEAHGLPIGHALSRVVAGVQEGARDGAAVLHARVERWATTELDAGRAGPARLVAGLFPAADAPGDAAMLAALDARERLIEQRADALVDRAQAADSAWLRHLGPEPAEPTAAACWRRRARTVAAYRERHDITDPNRPLGAARLSPLQQHPELRLAAQAVAAAMPPPAGRSAPGTSARRSTRAAPAGSQPCPTPLGR
jgi:hypothetical protein